MSKLADILFKPIGIVVSADKVQIVRPNGDKISCAKECYFFLGDKIVNNSDEDVEVTINGEKVKLEPKESTTVVSIDQKTIDNIALLQKELIKGKSIDELEDTTAGKNLLDSVGAISDIVFIKSGHYSNVHASANDIDFIQNIKELEMAGPKQPNISEKSNNLYIPVTDKPSNIIPIESQVGGGGAPQVGDPTLTPSPAITSLNIGPSTKIPGKDASIVFEPDEGIDDHPEPPEVPMAPIDSTLGLVFPEDRNQDGRLGGTENKEPYITTIVRVMLNTNKTQKSSTSHQLFIEKEGDDDQNSWRYLTPEEIERGYADFEINIRKDFGNTIRIKTQETFSYYPYGVSWPEPQTKEIVAEASGDLFIEPLPQMEIKKVDISFIEDINNDHVLTQKENNKDWRLDETTLRVKIPKYSLVGDYIIVTKRGDPTAILATRYLEEETIEEGYVNFSLDIEGGKNFGVSVHAERDGVRHSNIASKTIFVEAPTYVKLTPADIIFSEDTNSDGHLTPAENNKWKNYTSLRIKLPEGAAVGDEVHVQMDEYWEWAPSKQITEEHLKKGYIDFGESVPILNYEKINVEAHITHDGATSVVKKPLIIDPDPLRGLELYISRINNYNNKIGDSDLGSRTVRAIIELRNAEKLNKGYEIEVEVNGKFVKAHKQTDGTFAADIRLADLKDDSDKKIIAKLKKATYNYDNGDGTFSIKDAPELEARGDYTINFTRSAVDILRVGENSSDDRFDTITIADVRNNGEAKIYGEVRGIFKEGDQVLLTFSNGKIVTANVKADGSFVATINTGDFGYPKDGATLDYGRSFDVKANYINDTGNYETPDKTFTFDDNTALFGLRPSFEKAENNHTDINMERYEKDSERNYLGFDFKNIINNIDSKKIYSEPNGGKLNLNLDIDFSAVLFRPDENDPDEELKYGQIWDSFKKEISHVMNGWKYEVYLSNINISDEEYREINKKMKYDFDGYHGSGYHSNDIKIAEGNIVDGKTRYTHDFDIKDYLSTKPDGIKMLKVSTIIIPPEGPRILKNIGEFVFDSDQIRSESVRRTDYSYRDYVFKDNVIIFGDVKGSDKSISDTMGTFSVSSDAESKTFYYTPEVQTIDMTGYLFSGTLGDSNTLNSLTFDILKWQKQTGGPSDKPDFAYLILNEKKYEGTIDPILGKVTFKNISTLDLKNDSDHKYEIIVGNRDNFSNEITMTKTYGYNLVDKASATAEEIEKSFVFSTTEIARESSVLTGLFADHDLSSVIDKIKNQGSIDIKENNYFYYMLNTTNNEGRIVTLIQNKFRSHFDHDFTIKIDVAMNQNINNGLFWYDPSDNKIKEIKNGEILIKAGTYFKDIRIIQTIKQDNESNYDVEDNSANEYGGITSNSNMGLRKQKVTITLKNADNDVLGVKESYVLDTSYDIHFSFNSESIDLADYLVKRGVFLNWSNQRNSFLTDGDRKIIFEQTAGSHFSIKNPNKIENALVEFKNESVNVTSEKAMIIGKLILNKGDNTINIADNSQLLFRDIGTSMSTSDLAANVAHSLTINGRGAFYMENIGKHYDFKGLHILRGTPENINKNFEFNLSLPYHQGKPEAFIENLSINRDVKITVSGAAETDLYIKNVNIGKLNGDNVPKIDFIKYISYSKLFIEDSSFEVNNINNIHVAHFKNSKLGIASGGPLEIIAKEDLSFTDNTEFLSNTHIVTKKGLGDWRSGSAKYNFDITIDKEFVFDDELIESTQADLYTFGSHANIGNQAKFNVNNAEMIFDNGSIFNGFINAGHVHTTITIKNGATFDGVIEMSDAINNITIEEGAILGPNFRVQETNQGNELESGRLDTLTVFENLDFEHMDVHGIDKLKIGTEARGEMINLDLVFNDLHNLLSNNSNIIKLWGDNDNNVTLRSETNKTFSVAADQSAVASQPYTRYEASDTATGTKYFIDVHNDINLQIL